MSVEAIADGIALRGLGPIFGVPGSGQSLELIDACERRGVPFRTVQHEGAGAIMAGTLGRLTGHTGVALSIKGPGLANMAAGLAACRLEALPVVAIAEAFPPDSGPERAHKRLDHGGFAAAVAKGRRYASRDLDFGEMAMWAEEEAPGPVLLELAGSGSVDPGQGPPPGAAPLRSDGGIASLLGGAERPIVIAGTLAIRQGWHVRLNGLHVPVFSTAAAKGVVDERRPHAAGVYTGVGLELSPERVLLPQADLVIGLGLRAGEVLAATPFAAPTLLLDAIPDPGFLGAVRAGLDVIAEVWAALGRRSWGVAETTTAVRELHDHMAAGPFSPAHALRAAADALGDETRLVIDTGYFCTIAEHAWQAPKPDLCLSSGSGRFMGIGLPQATAAALYDSRRPTVLLAGDGGLGPYVAEARTAAQRNLPLVCLHLSDGGYGSVRTRALRDGLTENPLLCENPSWRGVFEGAGWLSERAGDEASLADTLSDWEVSDGPLFVEVPFDPDAYQKMVEGIR